MANNRNRRGKPKAKLQIGKHCPLSKDEVGALKELMQQRLLDCGWRHNIQELIRSVLEKQGVLNICYQQLAMEIIPIARALVPQEVCKELQQRVRETLEARF